MRLILLLQESINASTTLVPSELAWKIWLEDTLANVHWATSLLTACAKTSTNASKHRTCAHLGLASTPWAAFNADVPKASNR